MKKQDLLIALEKVRPGLANKDQIQHSTSFAFMQGRIVTYNDEISISHKISGIDIQGAVKAEELYKFLSKTTATDLDITTGESMLMIKAGKAKVELVMQGEIKLPLEELGEMKGWKPLPADFIEALNITRFCCSKDMSKPVLTCINFHADTALSCDRFRIMKFHMEKKSPFNFLLPASAAAVLISYPVTHMTMTPGWAHFADKEKELIFSCRTYSDNYPDLAGKMDLPDETLSFIFPPGTGDIIDRAQIFINADSFNESLIEISIEGRKLIIRAQSSIAKFEEWIKAENPGQNISTMIHPVYLKDILKQSNSCRIVPGEMIRFDSEKWIHAVQLQNGAS